MKVSKIPGLGRFGVFIDDVDFENISDDEWKEIGKIHLSNLVTIFRNTNLTTHRFQDLIFKFGSTRSNHVNVMFKKYGKYPGQLIQDVVSGNDEYLEKEDREIMLNISRCVLTENGKITAMLKVTGKQDEQGNPLGMFAEGELLWHSNESGQLTFTPGVALLANSGVIGSATGFLTTTDWYELQSESFRSELDEMVLLHKFTPGKINPGLRAGQDLMMNVNMCPAPSRIPLVISSPGGLKGLHYSINTIDKVEGMSDTESELLLKKINDELFVDKYIYDHWYQSETDMCLFDNSITLHRRLGGIKDRMCYRMQHDYTYIQPNLYMPYLQSEFSEEFVKQMKEQVEEYNGGAAK
jgi:alpha-ketoglutarate-dependent taurine dioxygenase